MSHSQSHTPAIESDWNANFLLAAAPLAVLLLFSMFFWKSLVVMQPQGGGIERSVRYSGHDERLLLDNHSGGLVGGLVGRLAVAARALQQLEPNAGQQVASVEVITALSTLNEQQPGQVYLIVTNISSFQLQINRLRLDGPDFITQNAQGFRDMIDQHQSISCSNASNASRDVVPADPNLYALSPNQAIAIAVNVSTACPVQPGNQLLVYEIGLHWLDGGQLRTGSLVAHQPIQVGVLGTSEIITLLGIPTFLFLPGFLALITLRLLWPLIPDRSLDKYLLEPTKPEFGVVAISLSGIAAVVYPLLTQRNYLVRYDLSDVVTIWLASVGAGVVFFMLIGTYLKLFKQIQKWHVLRRTITERDEPLTVLYKLDRLRLGTKCKRLDLKVEGESKYASLLQQVDAQTYWVSPRIQVVLKDNTSSILDREVRRRAGTEDAGSLADYLKQHSTDWTVKWEDFTLHHGPFQVRKEEISTFGAIEPLVEVHTEE